MKDDLNQLKVLAALGRTRRVGDAAQELGMTQSGVSNALRRLRQRFDDPLLVSTPRGMEPTPRGDEIVRAAQDILRQYKERIGGAGHFDPCAADTEFCFATSDIGDMVFLPRIIDYIRHHAPSARVRTVSLAPRELARALEEGSVDLAIGYFPDIKGNTYFQQRLFSHSFVCLVRSDHPLARHQLTSSAFLSLDHAVIESEARSQELFEQYLRQHGLKRRVALYVQHFMSIPVVISKSDLIVTVPLAVGTSFQSFTRLKLLKPPFAIPRFDLKQYWHRRLHRDARNVWLRSMMSSLFNESQDEWGTALSDS